MQIGGPSLSKSKCELRGYLLRNGRHVLPLCAQRKSCTKRIEWITRTPHGRRNTHGWPPQWNAPTASANEGTPPRRQSRDLLKFIYRLCSFGFSSPNYSYVHSYSICCCSSVLYRMLVITCYTTYYNAGRLALDIDIEHNLKTYNDTHRECKIFINEDLTARRAALARNTRSLKKERKLSDCWTTGGNVMVKELDGKIRQVKTEADLKKY